jgi:general secretion pathway protein H
MPISATGRSDRLVGPLNRRPCRARLRHEGRGDRGFTLIELLVTLVIMAIIVSMVAISSAPNPQRAFREEGDRIAQLLMLAREEAQIRSAPVRMQYDDRGYRFVVFRDQAWRVLDGDPYLRPRLWEEPTRLIVERADGDQVLEFGRDLIDPPFSIHLIRETYDLRIVANGLGSFEVLQSR